MRELCLVLDFVVVMLMQASSKCLVFLSSWRAGVFAGGVLGSGFAIAKTSGGTWTGPCFVTLKKFEIGAFFGVEKVL